SASTRAVQPHLSRSLNSKLERLAPGRRALGDGEADALVDAKRSCRVRGVDTEDPGVHAAVLDDLERTRDECASEPAPAVRPPREHAVQPAALQTQGFVLVLFDGVDRGAGY